MGQVKLILREDVPKLGHAGEVVSVKPGYARNFLLPQGKAALASEAKVKELEHHKRLIAEKVARELKDLSAARDRLEQLELEVEAQAGEEGKLFGSVNAHSDRGADRQRRASRSIGERSISPSRSRKSASTAFRSGCTARSSPMSG